MSSKTLPSLVSPDDQKVTFVELFFDLVFVFSVTQVVGFLHEGLTLNRVGEAIQFSLAHFPMLCGIVGVALAIEEGLLHPADPVPLSGRLALGTGLFLFLGGSALSSLRALGKLPRVRLLVAAASAGVIVALGGAQPWLGLSIGLAGTVAIILSERR